MREKAPHPGQTKLESAINVTPLVDVCLVLLVIFMIVTPLIKNPVELPPAATGSPFAEEERQLTITLADDGILSVGSLVIAREQLPGELRALYAQHPNRPVVLQADRRVGFGDVRDVLRSCRETGFVDVSLAVARVNVAPPAAS
jgi:biopolymer transport protein ExbD